MKAPIKTFPVFMQEDNNYDPIFGLTQNGQYNRKDRDRNDYERQIFSTSKSINVYAVSRANIVTGVRVRTELANRIMHSKIKQNKNVPYPEMFQGVYVIEKFIINRENFSNPNEVIRYIRDTNNLELEYEQVVAIREMFNHASVHDRGYVIRLVHFIPIDELVKNHEVYLTNVDILITTKNPGDSTMHPMSELGQAAQANVRVSEYGEPNIIAIDITNVDHPGKQYYMKIGSTVHKLTSTINNETPNGYSVVVKHQGTIIENKRGGLDKLSEAGIYETYDDANYNGNSEILLKYATLKHNLESLEKKKETEELRLTNDKLKMENELEVLKEKRRQEIAKWRQDKKKRKHDLKVVKEKHLAEMKILETKHKHELELQEQRYKQSLLDYDKKALDNKNMMDKHSLEIGILRRKHLMEIKIFKDKVIYERNREKWKYKAEHKKEAFKNNNDKIKAVLEIIGKLLGMGILLMK